MFFLRRPPDSVIRDFLKSRQNAKFSFPHVGAARIGQPQRGFNADHARVVLGHGDADFERAAAAVRAWRMFPPQIVELCWPEAPIEPGVAVAGLYRGPGFWAVLPCRIVYVIDETASKTRRFGFGYGTVAGHWECGEEQFLVEQLPGGDVVYDLFALSRPAFWRAKLGYPFTRREQARFRRLSCQAMQAACANQFENDFVRP